MSSPPQVSRRERQILDALYVHEGADVATIQSALPQAPGGMAIRRLLRIMEDKGLVRCQRTDRKNLYYPKEPRRKAGLTAFRHVLDTFFKGSVDDALALHLSQLREDLSDEDLKQLMATIDSIRNQRQPPS